MTAPLVSVVVPVLNGERYLAESLDSILAQTYPALEVLVMDDGSTDGTGDIIAGYGDRVRHHRQSSPLGIYENVNSGIALARGELIATYHADDVYRPEIVARQVDYLARHPEAGAVFTKDVFIDADGRPFGALELPPELRRDDPLPYALVLASLLRYKNTILRCPSAMVRAAVHRELGGYNQEVFKNTSDLEMWLRIARRYPIGIIDDHLFFYRRGHGSSSERYHRLRLEPERFFTIVDLELGRASSVKPPAQCLAAYEGHRAEDLLKIAAANYVADDRDAMRRWLSHVTARQVSAGSSGQRRVRLLTLLGLLRTLERLPRTGAVARRLSQRLFG